MENQILDENNNLICASPFKNNQLSNTSTYEIPKSKKTVFEFDRDETYDLFMSHGLPTRICDRFLSKGFFWI